MDEESKWLHAHNIPDVFKENLTGKLSDASDKCKSDQIKKAIKDTAVYIKLNPTLGRQISHDLCKDILVLMKAAQQDSASKPLMQPVAKKQKK